MSLILIRYGELALKSQRVRRRFEEHLLDGIARQFARYGLDYLIEREHGRFFLRTSDMNLHRSLRLLTHIPGIVSVSRVTEFRFAGDLDVVLEETAAFARGHLQPGQSFAVRARRTGEHPFTSQEAAALAGERILQTISDLTVDLKHPDVTVFLEVRGKRGFLFTDQVKGIGGLPPGSQGKVILLLSGPGSMMAGFLMMKRGCRIIPVHFLRDDDTRGVAPPGPVDGGIVDPVVQGAFLRLLTYDPLLKLRCHRGCLSPENVLWVIQRYGATGVVIGIGYSGFEGALHIPGEPVFHPLVGLDGDHIARLSASMEEFYREFGERGIDIGGPCTDVGENRGSVDGHVRPDAEGGGEDSTMFSDGRVCRSTEGKAHEGTGPGDGPDDGPGDGPDDGPGDGPEGGSDDRYAPGENA